MRPIILLVSILLTSVGSYAQIPKSQVKVPGDPGFEMKQYYFVMLVKGKNRERITDTGNINKIQVGHLANIKKLAEMGKLLLAGPFANDGHERGIFVFDCQSEEEVKTLLSTDPAIASGALAYKIYPWYTSKNCLFQ